MKITLRTLLVIAAFLASLSLSSRAQSTFKPKEVYKSDHLTVIQLTKNSFKHISFKQTNDFGNVPCNGLIVRNGNEVIIFDTPTNDKISAELIKWIGEALHCKINAVIPTHFHDDCLGGLQAFDQSGIPSYAYFKTIELAKANNLAVPKNSFRDSLNLKVGKASVTIKFFGEGHTKDNVIGYFPSERVLFGGCLVKEINASKGYLGDANILEWSNTVEEIKKAYPAVKIVVPGHGEQGDAKLLDYTINLFKAK